MVFEGWIQVAPWWTAARTHGICLRVVYLEGSCNDIIGIWGFTEEIVLKKKIQSYTGKDAECTVSVDHPQQIWRQAGGVV